MGFPTNNVHRRNRRALTRGASVTPAVVTVVVTGSGSTVTFTFSSPVNVSGVIPISIAVVTFVSQAVVSPTVVTQLQSGALAGHAYTLAQPVPNTSSPEGGVVVGSPSGTF